MRIGNITAMIATAVAWCGAGQALAQDLPAPADSGEEERRALEEALGADRAAARPPAPPQNSEGSAPATAAVGVGGISLDLSFILDVAGAWYSQDPAMIGGHDPKRTGFHFQGLELAVQSNVDPYFRFVGTMVFSQFGVEVEEAYGQTLSLPFGLQVRAGQMLTRFGRINGTHPHQWAFADQPLVVGKFLGSEGSRGLGAEISWLTPLPWFLEVSASMTDAAGECCARSFLGGRDLGIHGIGDFLYTASIRQFFPFGKDWSLLFGLSGQWGPNATGHGNRTEIYGTDLYLRYRPAGHPERMALSWTVEGFYRVRQVPEDSLRDFGGYAQMVWQITRRWETGVRYEFVSGIAADPLDPDWTGNRHRAAVQATFHPSHFSRIRLQGNGDFMAWRPKPVFGAILNLELSVGAHGAHSF